MNCCDTYGECRQSDDCPVRTGKVLPHQAAHARRVAPFKVIEVSTPRNHTEHPAVARIKSTRPVWMDGKASAVPPEAGNFKIIELGPDDTPLYDGQPLSHAETMALVRLMIYLLLGVLVVFGGLGLATSYSTERWPDVLWAFLQGVS
jgi:hypothetical protein